MLRPGVGAVGDNRAVQKCQIGIVGMVERNRFLYRVGDRPRRVNEIPRWRGTHVEPQLGGVDERVEGTPVCDIHGQLAVPVDRYGNICGRDKGGDTAKPDCTGTTIVHIDLEFEQPGRNLHPKPRHRLARFDEAVIDGPLADGDRGMAAHRRVARIVGEEHGEIGIGMVRGHWENAVHVGVATRFVHEQSAEIVEVLGGVATFGKDRVSGDLGVPVDNDSDRFSSGMHLHGLDTHRSECMGSRDWRFERRGSLAVVSEIVVVGSLNLDTTVRVPRLPVPGETILGLGHFEDTGGKGGNQAVAAARLGRDVAMIGMVGNDDAGRRLRSSLTADGVDTDGVIELDSVRSGIAVITVDEDGENMIVVDPGANGAFDASSFASQARLVRNASVVLLQLEIPLETVAAAVQVAEGTVVLNPAPAADLDRSLLELVDVFVPNATELARFAGGSVPGAPDEAITQAQSLDGPRAVVVTLGSAGAVVVTGDASEHVPAPAVDAVDPTAAGDAFCGGLADALVRGQSLIDATRWAVRCGAVAATRWGAQGSLPTRDEVLEMVP